MVCGNKECSARKGVIIMNPTGWLRSTVLEENDLSFSDGRPLYAYQCRDPLYQTMAKQLPGALQRVGQKSFIDDSWNPMFCLYAAEWWRRNYSSGPWSWDGIYESIGWQSVTSHERSERVANGLKWWKRTVFKREGRNLFLVTIACEGGLPLQLLQRENQYLGTYFNQILKERQKIRDFGGGTVELAERLSDRLPASLRQDSVYELSGRLVDAVSECRSRLGGIVEHPLRELDKLDPEWRASFPLRLDDEIARTLLRGLLQQRVGVDKAITATDFCTVSRGLVLREKNQWMMQVQIELPDKIKTGILLGKLNGKEESDLPQRIEVSATISGRQYSLGLLSKLSNQPEFWRVQFASGSNPLTVSGEIACESVEIIISAGQSELARWIPDSAIAPSEDLPWSFVSSIGEIDERTKQVDWAGEGAVTTTHSCALLVLPDNSSISDSELFTAIGRLSHSQQQLMSIDSSLEVVLADGEQCSITLAASEDDLPVYQLIGEQMYGQLHSKPIYLSLPKIYRTIDEERFVVPLSQLRWRPYSRKKIEWRSVVSEPPVGDVRLRHIGSKGIQFESRLIVLPNAAKIGYRSSALHGGKITLSGFDTSEIVVDSSDSVEIEVETSGAVSTISVGTASLSRFNIPVQFSWSNDSKVRLRLPVPLERAAFVRDDGVAVAFQSQVSIDELLGMRAVLVGSNVAKSHIDVDLTAPGHYRDLKNICSFRLPLSAVSESHYSVALGPLIPKLRRLMACLLYTSDAADE